MKMILTTIVVPEKDQPFEFPEDGTILSAWDGPQGHTLLVAAPAPKVRQPQFDGEPENVRAERNAALGKRRVS